MTSSADRPSQKFPSTPPAPADAPTQRDVPELDDVTVSADELDDDRTARLPDDAARRAEDEATVVIPDDAPTCLELADASAAPTDDGTLVMDAGTIVDAAEAADQEATVRMPTSSDSESDEELERTFLDVAQQSATLPTDAGERDRTILNGGGTEDPTLSDGPSADGTSRTDAASQPKTVQIGAEATAAQYRGDQTSVLDDSSARRSEPHRDPSPSANTHDTTRYDVLDVLARGGLGQVRRARDERINREVAYKELLPKSLRQDDAIDRFIMEAQITGQLEHPGIVPIYDLGTKPDGTPFYCMKLLAGTTLRDAIRSYHALPQQSSTRRLALARLLRNFIDICNAVAFAHSRGVIHRDLKPVNVLLGDFGETIVIDWGLAKIFAANETAPDEAEPWEHVGPEDDEQTRRDMTVTEGAEGASLADHTGASRMTAVTGFSTRGSLRGRRVQTSVAHRLTSEAGSVMGTVNYMSPEQAMGMADELDPRSDIYSLGIILYEILAGRSPVPEGKVSKKLKFVIEGRIESLRTVDSSIPKPLEAICLRAVARRKEDRYPTALSLAGDIEAWLADEPVTAYRDPWSVRLRRFARRHRTLVSSAAVALVLLIAGWFSWRFVEDRRIERIRVSAERYIADARAALESSDFVRATDLLKQAGAGVRNETALATMLPLIDSQLENVGRLRRNDTERQVERMLAEADAAIARNGDHQHAKDLLSRAQILLRDGDPALAALRTRVGERLERSTQALQLRDARIKAQNTFQEFERLADQARFYGSRLGISPEQDAVEARKHAAAALRLFGLDRQKGFEPPPHLDAEQVIQIRNDALELLLILADAEWVLARRTDADGRKQALERCLESMARAASLEIPSRVLHLYRSEYLTRLGREDEAAAAAQHAETVQPGALDFFLWGEMHRRSGRYDEALRMYEETLRRRPGHFLALNFSALCQLRKGEPQAAASLWTAAVAQRPDDFPWVYLTRAIALTELQRFDQALADLVKAEQLGGDAIGMEVHLNRGGVFHAQKKYAAAIAEFREAVRRRPDRDDGHVNLGVTYHDQAVELQQQDPEAARALLQQALEELTQALEISPANPNAFKHRARVHSRLENADAAIRDYRRAAEFFIEPNRIAECHREIGRLYHLRGEFAAAEDAYDDALQENPEDPDLYRMRAELWLKTNRFDDAVRDFTEYLERAEPVSVPGDEISPKQRKAIHALADVYRSRGLAKAKLGRYHEAVSDYTRALELESAAPHMLTRRGWAFLLQADDLALKDFEQAVQLSPEDPDSHAGLAYARFRTGNYQAGIESVEQALRLAQKHVGKGAGYWPLIYNPATVYAAAVGEVEKDRQVPEGEREKLAARYAGRAVELIGEALRIAGAEHRKAVEEVLRTDEALDPIRNRPEFQQILAPSP